MCVCYQNAICFHFSLEWRGITNDMYRAKNALEATHFEPSPYLLNKLLELSEILELIQRALEVYLETKRQLFPRFYFISNDDLLEVLHFFIGNFHRQCVHNVSAMYTHHRVLHCHCAVVYTQYFYNAYLFCLSDSI